ncbi:MAG: 16S rRNA (adenine(1518)-N(6)/adenine(1519)-N(6))-dimethyltransferase RsmA [Alphaproteobacteria bacterium]|nr:16S rRNA (adenine(1518)-N(6)/adenine(1519)-N(6))-dimethyltransferase RsmA [Alphaproteobacteria bacterium]
MPNAGALPPLRDVIARHGIRARKSLGQNFLLDGNLLDRIARAAGDLADCDVVEVGAGPGGLTRALLARGARRVIAIDRDPRCVAALDELAHAHPGRLEVIAADALDLDLATLADPPIRIVGNLPFNVATPLLLRWLANAERYRSMTLMFQREVVLRLAARPRTKDYGRLSVVAQWRCAVHRLFDVPARAFVPAPKVTASVVDLIPKAGPITPELAAAMERVTAAAFGQRRKMLRSSLKALGVPLGPLFAATGIGPTARAEELDIDRFVALAREWLPARVVSR